MKYILSIFIIVTAVSAIGQERNNDYQYALIEAVKQKNLGNVPGAIELYKIVIDADDSVAVAYYELGTLYILTKKIDLARQNLKRAWELEPSNEWYMDAFVDVLVFREEFREAMRVLDEYMKTRVRNPEWLFKKANILFVAEKNRKAIRLLNKIEKEYGISEKIILLKANIFEKQDKLRKAVNEIDKLLEYFPESVDFRIVAAEMSMEAGNDEAARDYYKQAMTLDSTNIFAITNLADYYQGKKDFKKSLYYLNKSFDSKQIPYDRKMAILGFYVTDEYFINKYTEEIELLIATVLENHPKERDIRLFATDFYIQVKKYNLALEAIYPLLKKGEKRYELWQQGILLATATEQRDRFTELTKLAVDYYPDSAEIVYYKGLAEFENNNYKDVIKTYSDTDFKSENKELWIEANTIKAEAYYKLEEFEIADSIFRLIIEADPDNYLVLNNFSYYLSLRGKDLEDAREMSFRTITDNPENGTFLDTYAWILYKLGEFEKAEKYINRAIQKGGQNDPDIMEHAAEIQKALGSYQMAISYYEKAIILGGNKEYLEKKIIEIEELE